MNNLGGITVFISLILFFRLIIIYRCALPWIFYLAKTEQYLKNSVQPVKWQRHNLYIIASSFYHQVIRVRCHLFCDF